LIDATENLSKAVVKFQQLATKWDEKGLKLQLK